MCVRVCTYLRVFMCVHVHTCARVHVYTCVCVYARVRARVFASNLNLAQCSPFAPPQ